MNEHILIALAGIGLIGILSQWLAWWVKLPAILFLLLSGIVAGPVTGWLDPDALFGELLLPMVSLAVAVILFEGSLTLRFEEIREMQRVVRRLVTIGVLVTWLITAVATRLLLGFTWEIAFLFGAVTVVTGPTVIVPLLRTVRPVARVASILRWEGIVIDPVGALLAVLVFELIVSGQGQSAFGHTLVTFLKIIATGLGLGAAAGYAQGVALRRHWLPDYLHNVATLSMVFAVFALSNVLAEESGLLAVTVMGMWLANMRGVPVEDILDFKESLSVFLISGLFIILAARMNPAQMQTLGWGAAGVFFAIQFAARPAKVAIATWGSDLHWRERALLAWIAPRGIVAAAVSALFALRLAEQGIEQASLLVPLTFSIIIGTVVLQSATAGPLARRLGVTEPEPKGFLIVGANPVSLAIGKALCDNGFRALLADTHWAGLREARMRGLDTWYGNPLSVQADRRLDLVGIGRLLALSPRPENNALAAWKFRGEFGTRNLHRLAAPTGDAGSIPDSEAARVLFGREVSYAKLASLLSQGAEIRSTGLTETFDFQEYLKQHGRRVIPLFAIDVRGRIQAFTVGSDWSPTVGWTVLGLIRPETPKAFENIEKNPANQQTGG